MSMISDELDLQSKRTRKNQDIDLNGNNITTIPTLNPQDEQHDLNHQRLIDSYELDELDLDGKSRRLKQEKVAKTAGIIGIIKSFFMSGLFAFFSTLDFKTFFMTHVWHYILLPFAPAFELLDIIADTYSLVVAKDKTDWKLLFSLGINVLKFAGVTIAVTLMLSGLAAASGVLATLAGAAFVFAVGVKTIFHAVMTCYNLAKSFNSDINKSQRSDFRHNALDHAIGTGICAGMTVLAGFVMLKGVLVAAAVGSATAFGGGLIGIGLMVKNWYRKKSPSLLIEESDSPNASLIKKNIYEQENSLKNDVAPKLTTTSSSKAQQPTVSWKDSFSGAVSSICCFFGSSTRSKPEGYEHKKTDTEMPNDTRTQSASYVSLSQSGGSTITKAGSSDEIQNVDPILGLKF